MAGEPARFDKKKDCFHQPAFLARAVVAIANHQPISTEVLQHAIGESFAASMQLVLALAHLLLLLSTWNKIRKTEMVGTTALYKSRPGNIAPVNQTSGRDALCLTSIIIFWRFGSAARYCLALVRQRATSSHSCSCVVISFRNRQKLEKTILTICKAIYHQSRHSIS